MEVDPGQRPERISVRGMVGWVVTKINNRPFRATNMPLPPPPNQTPLPISREKTLQRSGRGFYRKRGADDGAICIYSFEHIRPVHTRDHSVLEVHLKSSGRGLLWKDDTMDFQASLHIT